MKPVQPNTGHGAAQAARWATVEETSDRFFEWFDSALTLAELLAVLDPRGHRQKLQDRLTDLVAAVDLSGDGALSHAELTAAVASLDANDNGRLDRGDHVPGPASPDEIDLVGILLPRFRQFDGAGPDSP